MDELDGVGELVKEIIADGITLRAFMLQTAVELARLHPDRGGWAEEFIWKLQARVARPGCSNKSTVVWELAHARIDTLGAQLREILKPPRA